MPDEQRVDPDPPTRPQASADAFGFGPNAWLVDEMFERFRQDPSAVSASWREFFQGYRPGGANLAKPVLATRDSELAPGAQANGPAANDLAGNDLAGNGIGHNGAGANGAGGNGASGEAFAGVPGAPTAGAGATGTLAPPQASPPPGAAGTPVGPSASGMAGGAQPAGELRALRGSAARVVTNMVASLDVPTATSFRVVPAKLLEANRLMLNNQLSRAQSGGKVSFTHLIGWALVKALQAIPALNSIFVEAAPGTNTPSVLHPEHINLGLAVDLERPDGSRGLMVPVIKAADQLDFRHFWQAYEDLVRKVRSGKAEVTDFVGATVTMTNPGTLGTVQSVPRLMAGQAAIIGVGAIDYPAEWQGADPRQLAELGVSKVVTVSSTYDHRVIQGAESGLFLQKVHRLLLGEDDFYDGIFRSMGVPYESVKYRRDVNDPSDRASAHAEKQQKVDRLINAYRVRGHLIAHLDPLDWREPQLHAELDPATYGLSLWDNDREFLAKDFGQERMRLGEMLSVLRDAYCRTVGVEYMHIMDPAQKRWIQRHVEGVPIALAPEEHRHILSRLNAAEALERFLDTKYIGQKRFGLEGAESAIPMLDAILERAADGGHTHTVMGMAHRGRLNVLINIVGKSYKELFDEFEGNLDPNTVQGSGDVKYHKGFRGKFTSREGNDLDVVLASNPSHLEAVGPVAEGMARALQERVAAPSDSGAPNGRVLAVLIHGDAAFAGQGVVAETLNMSALPAYETGGTVHLVINNQLGFTTNPESARSSVYATDVAKMVQAPIFHVNGDDPEACVRVGRLAFDFRQEFHKDVVVDMVCYRRFGHNEQDDPSLTQPVLYQLIKEHRSVRKLYTEALVRRGDITLEEAEAALGDFSRRLQSALDETRASAPPHLTSLPPAPAPARAAPKVSTAVDLARLGTVVDALTSVPDGFTLHPKIAKWIDTRSKLWAAGEVDWALGEALAYGSLVLDGRDVRLCGQDTRRGTFGHRNSVYVDYRTGAEYVPLAEMTVEREGSGRFFVYDSLLSEYAAMGFEYGYSFLAPEALVAWEAQFGDFANGAQVVIDQFIVASETKWDERSGLVLLLPHGYEGQGAEHSSARIERFLTLCAEDNICVANVTTAGQLFHLLRRQAHQAVPKPLVLLTPKRYLRAREAYSPASELAEGSFHEVLDDPDLVVAGLGSAAGGPSVRRVVLATGKVSLDLMGARRERNVSGVAVVRVEQLYPWPEEQLAGVLARYPEADLVWAQEEPANMGAASFVASRLSALAGGRPVSVVARVASGSPATGSHTLHELEQRDIMDRALGVSG